MLENCFFRPSLKLFSFWAWEQEAKNELWRTIASLCFILLCRKLNISTPIYIMYLLLFTPRLCGLTFCDVRQCFLADNVYFVWAVSDDAYLWPLGRDYFSHHPTSNFFQQPSFFPRNSESVGRKQLPAGPGHAELEGACGAQTHKVLTVCRSSNRKLTGI